MQKFEGIHFYVNVANFNEVVIDEETKNGKVNHSIHALDTFFSGIESFGKKNFSEKFVIEKSLERDCICMLWMMLMRHMKL